RILFLLDVGGAQVLATGKPPGAEIDFKYALIGTAVGVAISAGFLALKICMIRRHLFEEDSSDLKSTPGGLSGKTTTSPKASGQICANSPTTESEKFPKICLLTSRNDFSFCHQSG
ncbi:C10orf128 isoform 6, partial [Pongo abelii]